MGNFKEQGTISDIQSRQSKNGNVYVTFDISINDSKKSFFVSCVAFKKIAEYIMSNCKNGYLIKVEGNIEGKESTNKDGRSFKSNGSVIVNNLQLLQIPQEIVYSKKPDMSVGQNSSIVDDEIPF